MTQLRTPGKLMVVFLVACAAYEVLGSLFRWTGTSTLTGLAGFEMAGWYAFVFSRRGRFEKPDSRAGLLLPLGLGVAFMVVVVSLALFFLTHSREFLWAGQLSLQAIIFGSAFAFWRRSKVPA